MTSSKAQAWNKKRILLNKLGSKYSLITKFGQFMKCSKRKIFIKNFDFIDIEKNF